MRKHIDSAYKILSKVFQEGTYSNMAFLGERVSDMSTRLVYGTLEENEKIDNIRELEQGKETVRLDKVNQALAMFGKEAVPGERED